VNERQRLVQFAITFADTLTGGPAAENAATVIRTLARELAAPSVEPGRCACGCGTVLTQPRTGRRRRWVDESHRSAARRR
jgi:hypothetical protein